MMRVSGYMRRPFLVVTLLAVLFASGCSILGARDPMAVYVLPSSASRAPTGPNLDWVLRVTTPGAGAGLSTTRISVMPEAQRLSVYEGARWSDPVPELLRDRLIEGFRADGRVVVVSGEQASVLVAYELDGDLGAFNTEYENGRPDVVIRFDARMVQSGTQQIVAAKRFEVREAVEGVDVPKVVEAFGRASDALTASVVEWSVEQGRAHAIR